MLSLPSSITTPVSPSISLPAHFNTSIPPLFIHIPSLMNRLPLILAFPLSNMFIPPSKLPALSAKFNLETPSKLTEPHLILESEKYNSPIFFIFISSHSTSVYLISKQLASETEIEPIRLFSTFIILNPADVRFPSISPSVISISPFCTNTASLHFIFIPSKVSPVASSIYKPNFSVSISTSLMRASDFSLMYIPYS